MNASTPKTDWNCPTESTDAFTPAPGAALDNTGVALSAGLAGTASDQVFVEYGLPPWCAAVSAEETRKYPGLRN